MSSSQKLSSSFLKGTLNKFDLPVRDEITLFFHYILTMEESAKKTRYDKSIKQAMSVAGLNDDFDVEVMKSSNFGHVLAALNKTEAQHIAVLTQDQKPIENIFEFLKEQFRQDKTVLLAFFFLRDGLKPSFPMDF